MGKSPPGGARRTSPSRASSGPISRIDPRRRPTSSGSGRDDVDVLAADADRRCADPLDFGADADEELAITPTSVMRGMLVSSHG